MFIAIWVIALLSIAGVIFRPFKIPEFTWAVAGAVLLIVTHLISATQGIAGIVRGTDVYLFLTGMMLLAETGREEKLFDWLAAHAVKIARGSPKRLFILVYLVGMVVTIFLSNDATAVVLTPAVAAAAAAAKVKNPLPYLLICAFVANAASFVLPISNPANLVIYGKEMPGLLQWIPQFILPSLIAIVITGIMLFLTQRKALNDKVADVIEVQNLGIGGKTVLLGIAVTAVLLLLASAFHIQLGLPTAIAGVITVAIVLLRVKKNPLIIIKEVSWGILPLVAGLFVIVEALNSTGISQTLAYSLHHQISQSLSGATWVVGFITAFGCNIMNNLPAGLISANVVNIAPVPDIIKSAVVIGIDLGPNLSVTGSLATILWMVTLRREKVTISPWSFLKLGLLIMTTALVGTLASLFI